MQKGINTSPEVAAPMIEQLEAVLFDMDGVITDTAKAHTAAWQRHINAATVYNIWQYHQASDDGEFLYSYGAEMMLEIARFWRSAATYNPVIDRYEIKGVMGPDEYHTAYPDADPEKAGGIDTIPKNVDYYLARTSHGSTLSQAVHSWVLARSDRPRSWHLFQQAIDSDIDDIQGGTTPEGIHVGAMAGNDCQFRLLKPQERDRNENRNNQYTSRTANTPKEPGL